MCSGCSGDYAGDFDDSGEPAGEGAGGVIPRSWGELNALQSRDLPAPSGDGSGEICEILVSAARIVEIRVIEAHSAEAGKIGRTEAGEMRAAAEHSTAASAKYYRTRRGGAGCAGDRVQSPYRNGVAARIVRAFTTCRRWARSL
jgi:hypothetical protein